MHTAHPEVALPPDPDLIWVGSPIRGGRAIPMVHQNMIAGLDLADYGHGVELGANGQEGTKADHDAEYRETFAAWLF